MAAARRSGMVITRRTALELGVSQHRLDALCRSGVLEPRHRGVYALAGDPRSPAVAARAALAAVGCGVASHGTAAWLAGFAEQPPPLVHLTAAARQQHRLRGVVVHRSGGPLKTRVYQGVRCTTPARTLLDCAACAAPDQLALLVDRAVVLRLVRPRDLDSECAGPTRRGTARLRACMDALGHASGPAPSVLEAQMLRLLERHGIPRPKVEVRAGRDGRYRIDFAYPECRLAIEVYGYAWHHSADQLTHDVARQRALTLEGWTVLVFTWREVVECGERVAAQIRAALAALRAS